MKKYWESEGTGPRIFYLGKGKGKVVLVLSTEHHAMKVCWGSRDIAANILDLDTRWR
jgi:hypothetical protein